MTQPNVTGDGDTRLTVVFWATVVLTGAVTGLLGAALMLLLFGVQHLAFGVGGDGQGFTAAVEATHGWRRAVPVLVAIPVAAVGWYLLRRWTPGKSSEADEVLWTGRGRLSFRRSVGTSVLSEVVVGLGVSLGREAAPKLMGAVAGSVVATRAGLTPAQLRLLSACGAGAGLASVYNVPLAGALFTAEVLVGSLALPVVLPALVCTATATATAWVALPQHATYVDVPDVGLRPALVVWALLAGPLLGLAMAGYVRLVGLVSHRRPAGAWQLVAPVLPFGLLAVVALRYPQVYGNGRGLAHAAFLGAGSIGLLAALALLKPLMTLLCLGSGASGGLLTPVLSTGAAAGGCLGLVWTHLWSGLGGDAGFLGAYALVGAAAALGAGMQAPLAAVALVLELTHSGFELMAPLIIATALATAVARWIDGYSIYTARLTSPPVPTAAAPSSSVSSASSGPLAP